MGILPLKRLFTIIFIVLMVFHWLIWGFYFWLVIHCQRIFIYGWISLLDFTYDFGKYDLRLNNAHSNGPNSIQLSIFPQLWFPEPPILQFCFHSSDVYFKKKSIKIVLCWDKNVNLFASYFDECLFLHWSLQEYLERSRSEKKSNA